MRAHVIENGVVTNTIEVENLDFMPGLIAAETGTIGWLWDGEKLTAPPRWPDLDAGKEEMRAAINAQRDAREAAGFPYLGKHLDSDSRSVQRIATAVQAAQAAIAAGQPFSIDWTCADGSVLTLDAAGVVGMPVALAVHGNALHQHARTLKAQVDAAETSAALEAIDITAGWPDS